MSDWPSKMPMGVAKFLLGRWKSGGGATWVWVAEPGCAHAGAVGAGVAGGVGACAESGYGAVQNGAMQNIRASSEGWQVSFIVR